MSKVVVMISPNNFPNGDAGAIRDAAFGTIYTILGYKVILICQNKEHEYGKFENIEFISLFQNASTPFQKLIRFTTYKKRLENAIMKIEQIYGKPSIIHFYDVPVGGIKYMIEYSSKSNIHMIHDSVEWYSPREFKRGIFDKSYILKNRLNRNLVKSPIKVIAISSYLENHFRSRGLAVVRIPAIMDTKTSVKSIRNPDDKVQIVYAGSPAKKDLLQNIITAYCRLNYETRKKLCLNIVGVSERQLIKENICTKTQLLEISDSVTVYGRIPRSEVLEVMRKMDFSVLVRHSNERYAQAGFPTKSVEAMMNSVAMLCNISSDLGLYLHHEENAIILKDESILSLICGYETIAILGNDKIQLLKQNARKTACENFDFKHYISKIEGLIED